MTKNTSNPAVWAGIKAVLDLQRLLREGCGSGANLSGADLSGANLSGADLSGANLSGAKGLQV